MFWSIRVVFLSFVLLLAACGSSGSTTPTPTPIPAPTIKVFATAVNNDSGGRCLLFVAAPSENLQMLSVSITHEVGINVGSANLGGQLVIPTDRVNLQPSGLCYQIITGEYRFSFVVTRPNSTTQITVNSVYNQINAASR